MPPTSVDRANVLRYYRQLRRNCGASPYFTMHTLAGTWAHVIAQTLAKGHDPAPSVVREYAAASEYAAAMAGRGTYWYRAQGDYV